jgi:biotin-(acetyl-CoA carboxylase) ligase
VLGIGVNVAVDVSELPADVRERAATLGRPASALEPTLRELLALLERRFGEPPGDCLAALRARDALLDRPLRWAGGEGVGAGIDDAGSLLVRRADGVVVTLDAGEVHLGGPVAG